MDVAIGAGGGLDLVGHDIAEVGHLMAEARQRLGKAGGAVGVGPHQAAAAPLAGIHRRADEEDVAGHGARSCGRRGAGPVPPGTAQAGRRAAAIQIRTSPAERIAFQFAIDRPNRNGVNWSHITTVGLSVDRRSLPVSPPSPPPVPVQLDGPAHQ